MTAAQNRAVLHLMLLSVALSSTVFAFVTSSYLLVLAGTAAMAAIVWSMRKLPAELSADQSVERISGDPVSAIPELAGLWTSERPHAVPLRPAAVFSGHRLALASIRNREVAALKLLLVALALVATGSLALSFLF